MSRIVLIQYLTDTKHVAGCTLELIFATEQTENGLKSITRSSPTVQFLVRFLFLVAEPPIRRGGGVLLIKIGPMESSDEFLQIVQDFLAGRASDSVEALVSPCNSKMERAIDVIYPLRWYLWQPMVHKSTVDSETDQFIAGAQVL